MYLLSTTKVLTIYKQKVISPSYTPFDVGNGKYIYILYVLPNTKNKRGMHAIYMVAGWDGRMHGLKRGGISFLPPQLLEYALLDLDPPVRGSFGILTRPFVLNPDTNTHHPRLLLTGMDGLRESMMKRFGERDREGVMKCWKNMGNMH